MAHLPLVTGASGFAGSHLLDRLVASHPRVLAWGRRAPAADADHERVSWRPVDVLDAPGVDAAVREGQPSVIYHCAGLPHVAESWKRTTDTLQVNALGTHHLLEAVRQWAPACKVIVVGSALVYRRAERALKESDPLGPSDPYGVSKLAQEMLGRRATTPVIVARPFNHAGPRQHPSFVTSSFAQQIAESEAGLREPVLLVGNLDSRRDITDVRDTVRGYEALAARGTAGEAYNVCAGSAHRVGDLLDLLLSRARVKIRIVQDPERLRPSDNPLVLGDPTYTANVTGWRAEIPIEQTMGDLLEWWRGRVAIRQS